MKSYYKVSVTYPDGHTEEIEESYDSLEKAKEFGDNIVLQVQNTERYHKNKGGFLGLFKRKKKACYYVVRYVTDDGAEEVFDSSK